MSEVDAETLAKMIATEIAKQAPPCKVFTADELTELKGVARLSMRSKSTALATVVGFIVLGLLGLIVAGIGVRLGFLGGKGAP